MLSYLIQGFGVLLLVFLLAGCKQASTDSASLEQNVFIFARGSDAHKLDPADVDDGESVNSLAQVCEGLIRFKPGSLEIEPWLAERYSISDDGLVYTFQLRPSVSFHDGTPLNAETALFTFQRQMDPNHPGHLKEASFQYWKYLFQDISTVEATGEMTLVFTLSQPNSSILYSLATFPAWLISPKSVGPNMQRHPVGTGPYRFVEWKAGQAIIFEKNEQYWASTKPQFDRVILKVVPENTVRLLELESEKIHGLNGLQPIEVKTLESDPRFTVYSKPGMNVGYMTINLESGRFQNLELRQALAMAINRQAIVDIALDGAGLVAESPLPPGFLGAPAPGQSVMKYDPETAKKVFAKHAAVLKAPIVISTFNAPRPYFPDPVKVASLIRDDLRKCGLNVELETRDFKSHLNALRNGNFELGLIGWIGDNGDPDNFLSIFFGSWAAVKGSATNYSFYRDTGMDDLLIRGRSEANLDKRGQIYAKVLSQWGKDLPLIPLVHAEQIVVIRSEVEGFRLNPTGNLDFGPLQWK